MVAAMAAVELEGVVMGPEGLAEFSVAMRDAECLAGLLVAAAGLEGPADMVAVAALEVPAGWWWLQWDQRGQQGQWQLQWEQRNWQRLQRDWQRQAHGQQRW